MTRRLHPRREGADPPSPRPSPPGRGWRGRLDSPTRVAVQWLLLSIVLFAGCVSRSGNSASGPVERLDLLLTALALDLDGKPGVDGFGARLYAGNRRSALGTPLTTGRLEFVMYDGVVRPEELTAGTPRHVWSYEPRALASLAQMTSIGTGYQFALAWGDDRPRRDRITIVARYTSAAGAIVLSAPGSISLTEK